MNSPSLEKSVRQLDCSICQKPFGYVYLESVWEDNDEKTWKLVHPICELCRQAELIQLLGDNE